MRGELLGKGGSSEVFAWGQDRVVKLFLEPYAYAIELEWPRSRAVWEARLPVPRADECVEVEGRPGIVFERVEGPLLFERLAGSSAQIAETGAMLADIHVELHGHRAMLDPLLERARERALARGDAVAERMLEILETLPEGDAICHGDMHPGNVIESERGPVTIDWPNACLAHPALDAARAEVCMRYQNLAKGDSARRRATRTTLADAYLERYVSSSGVTRDDVRRCLPFPALALLAEQPDNAASDTLSEISGFRP